VERESEGRVGAARSTGVSALRSSTAIFALDQFRGLAGCGPCVVEDNTKFTRRRSLDARPMHLSPHAVWSFPVQDPQCVDARQPSHAVLDNMLVTQAIRPRPCPSPVARWHEISGDVKRDFSCSHLQVCRVIHGFGLVVIEGASAVFEATVAVYQDISAEGIFVFYVPKAHVSHVCPRLRGGRRYMPRPLALGDPTWRRKSVAGCCEVAIVAIVIEGFAPHRGLRGP